MAGEKGVTDLTERNWQRIGVAFCKGHAAFGAGGA
jgi:hypothetical protein